MNIDIILEDLNEEPPGKVQVKQNIIHRIIGNIFTNRCSIRHCIIRVNRKKFSKYNSSNVSLPYSVRDPFYSPLFIAFMANGIHSKK